MASIGAITTRKAQALQRIVTSVETLAGQFGVEVTFNPTRHRDRLHSEMFLLEGIADYLEGLTAGLGGVTSPPNDDEDEPDETPDIDEEDGEDTIILTPPTPKRRKASAAGG